jgi:hypothetical protein
MSLQQLYDAPVPDQTFLIDQLLPSCGITLAIGKPKGGKSTLLRQMIAAVATGEPFLGFRTVKSKVVYFAIEEWAYQVGRHFLDLGLPHDARVQIHTGLLGPSWLEDLRRTLESDPEIKLVVIDPLFLAMTVKDANEYAPVMKAMSEIAMVAREFRISIVCVHHSKKSMSADAGDNSLGSTALRGSADATWQILKGPDGKRTFQTEMRYGVDLPPTVLVFDADNRSSTLGGAEADLEARKAATKLDKIADGILDFVGQYPLLSRSDIIAAMPFKTSTKNDVFTRLEREGLIRVSSGTGVKGSPFLYAVTLPTETQEA